LGRIGLDSNVFLCVLLPKASKTDPENVHGARRILGSLGKGNQGVTSAIALAEVAWAFLRESKKGPEFEAAKSVITGMEGLEIESVTSDLAWSGGKLRARHYSKKRFISYQDSIYLATSIKRGVDVLYSTDSHLLEIQESIPVVEPKRF
jgi:predicted nucleic acid-binding protein